MIPVLRTTKNWFIPHSFHFSQFCPQKTRFSICKEALSIHKSITMIYFGRLGRKALAPSGGVASVATMSFAWSGERSSSRFCSRTLSRTTDTATRNLFHRHCLAFSSSSTPKTTQTAAPKRSGGFVEWYEGHLNTRPVVTKMCTGSILWGIGDAVAQLVPLISPSNESQKNEKLVYDFTRTGRAVTFGFLLHAPASHLHFNFLEWMTVKAGLHGLKITVFKTVMEQFVYWSWISNSMYHAAMGAMQGMNPSQIYDRVADVLWDTQVAQWIVWIPIQLLNFRFVPVRHQLNVVLVASIGWTALLSFWYPPEKEEEEPLATNMVSEAVHPHAENKKKDK